MRLGHKVCLCPRLQMGSKHVPMFPLSLAVFVVCTCLSNVMDQEGSALGKWEIKSSHSAAASLSPAVSAVML